MKRVLFCCKKARLPRRNILFLLFSFTIGGTERLVADICNELANKDCHIYLYIINDLYDESILQTLSKNVFVIYGGRKVGHGGKLKSVIRLTCFGIKKHIEVIHCNSFYSPEALFLLRLLRPHIRIVQTVHDVHQFDSMAAVKKKIRSFICNHFIAISGAVKADMIRNGISERKISVINNAIKLDRFPYSGKLAFRDGNIVVGCVARIDIEKKAQDILLRALSESRHRDKIRCLFAGAADSYHTEDLENLKKLAYDELGFDRSQIRFLGSVDDIYSFLKTLDIFVLPSNYEGFGISLIEAMAVGIPCIASNVYGPAEIIGSNERGLLFERGNSTDLSEKLDEIIVNYSCYKSKALEIREFICRNFSIEMMCDKLLELYGV